MRVLPLALLMMLASLSAFAATNQTVLAEGDVLHGTFREERHMKGFDGPMLSSGHFVVAPQHGVIWAMEKPFITTTVITPTGLAQSVSNKIVIQLPSQKIPFMLRLYDMLGGALKGDWAPLESDFTITRSGDVQNWHVVLTPRQTDNPAMPFSSIDVTGRQFVEKVIMIKPDGDTDMLTFINQHASHAEPTADELHLFKTAPSQVRQ